MFDFIVIHSDGLRLSAGVHWGGDRSAVSIREQAEVPAGARQFRSTKGVSGLHAQDASERGTVAAGSKKTVPGPARSVGLI